MVPGALLGFNQKSPALRELLHSDRFRSITGFTDDRWMQRDPDVGDSAEGLLKKVGVVEGASDVSWHKDCSMGGHTQHCCGLVTGISVTGAGRETASSASLPDHTAPTSRSSASRGSTSRASPCPHAPVTSPFTARVVYTGFGLAPRPGEHRNHMRNSAVSDPRSTTASGSVSRT